MFMLQNLGQGDNYVNDVFLFIAFILAFQYYE